MNIIKCERRLIINPSIIEMSYSRNERLNFEVVARVDGLWVVIGESKSMLTAKEFKEVLVDWLIHSEKSDSPNVFEVKSTYLD